MYFDTLGDTGRDKSKLEKDEEFVGIDFSDLEDDWNGKQGDFDPANVPARAKWVRQWLRARPEKEIVGEFHHPKQKAGSKNLGCTVSL